MTSHYPDELYLSAPSIVLPARRYSNDQIVERVQQNFRGSDQEWRKIRRRLNYVFAMFGSKYRYLEDDDPRPLADYAAEVSTACLKENGVGARSVDAMLYGGVCREFLEPATAVQVAARAGIRTPAVAMDISAACAGVINAIIVFAALAATQRKIRTGVITAIEGSGRATEGVGGICYDIQSASDLMSRAAGLTIGNAGGAMLVGRSQPRQGARLLASLTESFTDHHDLSTAHVNGTFRCDSFGLFREWRLFPPHLERLASSVGWSADDVSYFCVHQPSDRLVEKIAVAFSIPDNRVPRLHAQYGNTVTLAPIMALNELARSGRLKSGDRILLSAAGSGITLTSLALEWL